MVIYMAHLGYQLEKRSHLNNEYIFSLFHHSNYTLPTSTHTSHKKAPQFYSNYRNIISNHSTVHLATVKQLLHQYKFLMTFAKK